MTTTPHETASTRAFGPAEGPVLDSRAVPRLLLAAVLLTAPAYCLFQAFDLLFHLFGESATPAEEAEAARWLTGAAWTALGASAAGLALSTGRRRATWGFGVATVLSLGLMVVLAPAIADLRPDAPVVREPVGCVERSGPPSTCPGG